MKFEITKQLFAQLLRQLLGAFAAFLITKGWVDSDLANAFVNEATGYIAGISIILILALWSYLKTKFDILAIFTALHTKPDPDVEPKQAFQEIKQEVKSNYTVPSI